MKIALSKDGAIFVIMGVLWGRINGFEAVGSWQ